MADPLWLVVVKLLAVVALVLLNAFFVAAEFAIVKVRATQMVALERAGDPRAKRARHVHEHLDAYLSACQLGITIASLGLGWIGEPAVAQLLEPLFLSAGIVNEGLLHTVSFAVAFTFITFLHIVFGELAPKSIAIRTPAETALRLSGPLRVFYVVFQPAINVLNGTANRLLEVAGFTPATPTEMGTSAAELREILAASARGGASAPSRIRLLLNLFDLGDRRAGDIMTPISRVVAMDVRRPVEENLRIAEDAGYTRFPLVDGSVDQVLGMVHYRDLSRVVRKDRPEQTLHDIRRDILLVPESQRADRLLEDMLARGRHMGVVVDEHGRTAGIVTMEDVFEEVFGSIRDEFDEPDQAIKTLGEGVYLVDGGAPLVDLEKVVGRPLRRPGVSTVSGLVLDALGRFPMPGDNLALDGIEMTVRECGRRRVRSVEVRDPRARAAAEGKPL